MRFWYPNLIDVSGVGITSTSAATGAPVSNVANELKTRVWRTGTSTAAESVTFDLGSSKACTAVILFAHTLLNTDSTIQLRKSTDNFAANDVLVTALTWASGAISATFASASSRYWRVVFTKASSGVTRDIGRIFMGIYTDTTEQPDQGSFKIKPVDRSTSSKSVGGQTYTDKRSSYRGFQMKFGMVSTTFKDAITALYNSVQTHTSFFAQVDTAGTTEVGEIVYVKLGNEIEADDSGADSDVLWNVKLELEEQL